MPQIFAIILCIMILVGLAGLVRLEYKRLRNGPRLSSRTFLNQETGKTAGPPKERRAIQHEIGY